MKSRTRLLLALAVAMMLPPAAMIIAQQAGARNTRPQGPCDVYAAAQTPCVAAHSSTRALFAAYNGPLYQVMRQSDGKTLDIGVVQPNANDGGGYANAASQDEFCANTYCWITRLYDQSGKKNDLYQAPRGGTGVPTMMGGFNSLPLADMAPVTIMGGHKVYGVYIEPGMGLRNNNPSGTAVDDQAQGQYWVINGHHYNSGCCYDYGNAEIDSRDDGEGTMETTYFGNAFTWYHGPDPGPWIMTDQENNLVGCVNENAQDKLCADLPIIKWRFVTAMAKGEPHRWASLGGDAQGGELKVMWDGRRVDNRYDPMRKQGAIVLGNGGDNSNSSQGTFYEGAMTAPNTFPSHDADQKVQANVVAAKYGSQRLAIAPAAAADKPPGLQTFTPGSSQDTLVTFANTSGAPLRNVSLKMTLPAGWNAVPSAPTNVAELAAGASFNVTFKVTAGPTAFNGDIVANATWADASGKAQTDIVAEKVRNVSPIKINEFGSTFIELYNAGDTEIDLSNWSVTEHPIAQATFSDIKIPAGTKLAAHSHYLLGLAGSGLAVPAANGDATIYTRSIAGMKESDSIQIGTGPAAETRKIAKLGTAAGANTTLWQPLPDGPVITMPAGSTSVPVASINGFAVGQKIGLGYGATYPVVGKDPEKYEIVTVTEVGKAGAQTALAADAKAGDTTIRLRAGGSVSAGDTINLDIDSVGHGNEKVVVKSIGDAGGAAGGGGGRGGRGGGGATIELAAPLKFNHAANLPLSVWGTGIKFQPASAHPHSSNEPVLPMGTGITLDRPLDRAHDIDAVVQTDAADAGGYQGAVKPNQWFGGPVIGSLGVIILRDAGGLVADSLNYGGTGNNGAIGDPWAAEGYQGTSVALWHGCFVPTPMPVGGGGRGGRGGAAAASANSAGRIRDGADADSNCTDFAPQTPTPGAPNKAAP